MNPASGWSDAGCDVFQEGNDVVVGCFFDLADGADVEGGFLTDGVSIVSGDEFQGSHGLTGKDFDFEPNFEFALLAPNLAHAGQGISFDHRQGDSSGDGVFVKENLVKSGLGFVV